MADSFLGLFWFGVMAGRPARHNAAQLSGLAIDETEVDVGEADDPVSGLSLGDADGLAGEGLVDVDELAAPLDLAAGADAADGVVGVVPGLFEFGRIGPRRGTIAAGRRDLAERLVRTVVVVVVAEAVEAGLLLGERGGGRLRGLLLEGAMHALVPAVLLRRAGVDALEPDAELDPVHREPSEAAGGGARGEGAAIVAADGARQTELAQGLVDHRLHRRDRLRHDAALDEEAAVGVGDGERVAARTVGGAEPALEVDAPEVVGLRHRLEGPGERLCRPPAPARRAQAFPAQQIADRRRRRPWPLPIASHQDRPQLLRPPIRPLAPQRHDRRRDLLGHRHAVTMRRPRARHQTAGSFLLIAPHQPIAGVTADAEALAQHRHRHLPTQILRDERRLLVHDAGFLPRHRQRPPFADRENLSGIYPVYSVRNLSGSDPRPPPHPALSPLGRGRKVAGHGPLLPPLEAVDQLRGRRLLRPDGDVLVA